VLKPVLQILRNILLNHLHYFYRADLTQSNHYISFLLS
jgi:hypothetical protein